MKIEGLPSPEKNGQTAVELFRVIESLSGWRVERISTQKTTLFRCQDAAEQYANHAARFKAPSEVILLRLDGSGKHLSRYR